MTSVTKHETPTPSTQSTPSTPSTASSSQSGGTQLKSMLRGSDVDVQMSMLHPVQRHEPTTQGAGLARVGEAASGQAPATPEAPVQRRPARAVQRMVVQREESGTPPAAPPGGAQTGGATGNAPPAADPAAEERQRQQTELQLKEAQLDEFMAQMRQHCAATRTAWQGVKTGWSVFTALTGGPIIAASAKVGAGAGLVVGGPIGAGIGAVLGAGAGLIGTLVGNNKVSKVIEQQAADEVEAELIRIEDVLRTKTLDIDIELALDLMRTDASNVKWIYDTVHELAGHAERAKALATQTEEQLAEQRRQEEAQKAAEPMSNTDLASTTSDVTGNVADTLQGAGEALNALGGLGSVLETVGNGADGIGVAIEAGKTAMEANTWRQAKSGATAAKAEVDRLRAALQLPPLPGAGGGT